jgi:hypothetical protein
VALGRGAGGEQEAPDGPGEALKRPDGQPFFLLLFRSSCDLVSLSS